MRRRLAIAGIGLVAGLVAISAVPGMAGAATIQPNILVDNNFMVDGNCSLRDAITIARINNGAHDPACDIDDNGGADPLGNDTIQLQAGTYTLSIAGLEDDNHSGDLDVLTGADDDLTIRGVGTGATRIEPADPATWTERIMHQIAGSSGDLELDQLTITGGDASPQVGNAGAAGGIFSQAGDLTLSGVRVTGNKANIVGGIAVLGQLSLTQSVVESNTALGQAGGILLRGSGEIDSSVVRRNLATQPDLGSTAEGGGIYFADAVLEISNSVIADNRALSPDGGLGAWGGGLLATQSEGASTSVSATQTTFSGNEVTGGVGGVGGGIAAADFASTSAEGPVVRLTNSTISGNEALGPDRAGAGLALIKSKAFLLHSTLGPNQIETTNGSAIYSSSPASSETPNLKGSVVETQGGRPACEVEGGPISGDNNVFTDSSCVLGPGALNNVADANLQLGAHQSNGGPMAGPPGFLTAIRTHLPLYTSPAVDHVPQAACSDPPTSLITDQRGLFRPIDRDGDSVAQCDAGSVELGTNEGVPPVVQPQIRPPAQPQLEDPCPGLRKKLKKAKKKLKKAKKADKPIKKKRRKVRKLRRKVRNANC